MGPAVTAGAGLGPGVSEAGVWGPGVTEDSLVLSGPAGAAVGDCLGSGLATGGG